MSALRSPPDPTAARSRLAAAALACALLIGCPSTQFFNEGSGQPSDRSSGIAPPGSTGACKLAKSKRPPLVSQALWNNLRRCSSKTPRRYLRLGYSNAVGEPDEKAERRMAAIMEAVGAASTGKDANVRMLTTLRTVRRQALDDPKLASRVERASGRTFACDYAALLTTITKESAKRQQDSCPATAYDPKERRDVCLFDERVKDARWLTSAWPCLAFTDTLGEGESCYRLCGYDDYCAAQVSCAQPDYDLVMCALGICMPEKIAGLY